MWCNVVVVVVVAPYFFPLSSRQHVQTFDSHYLLPRAAVHLCVRVGEFGT